MARRRFGVVLLVPDPVRREVDGLRRALGAATLGLVPAHLTLVPPVNVKDEHLDAGLAKLRAAGQATLPFDLRLGPPTTFHPVTPTVYLAVGGDVDAVHRLRHAVFARPFARKLDHAFVPHVTLAEELPIERIGGALDALAEYVVDVAIDRLHVLEELRTAGGRRAWEPIADVPFRPRVVLSRGGLELEVSTTELVAPDAATTLSGVVPGDPVGADHRPGHGLVVTGRRAGVPVGLAVGWTLGHAGFLDVVAVSEQVRREGVGSHLVAHFEAEAEARGCLEVMASTPDEPAILALLARRGWARRPDRGRPSHEPVLLRRSI
jgi:2'-5' RNA ligase